MRPVHFVASLLAVTAIVLSGCGYAGEPKPPALRRPIRVGDLAAVERGSKIVVTFTLPEETTEGLPITEAPDIEMRIGAPPAPWNEDGWQASADRIPVQAWQFPRAASGAQGRNVKGRGEPVRPSGGSGARQQQKAAKAAAAAVVAANRVLLSRTIDIDASRYTGKSVVIGVRVHGPKGRDDGWSNFASLEVFPVLPAPASLRPTDAPGAVHLQWVAEAPAFRIYRKLPTDSEWAQIGESTQPSFDDKTVEFGKQWQYRVQSVRKVGENWLESDPSETIAFTPKDSFPPATPAGLGAISGTGTIELYWDRVADADLASYRVYRNGVKIADAVLTTAYSDKNVAVGTKYSYQVSAVDQAGNESGRSAAFEITME